jgi:hypothetical protein
MGDAHDVQSAQHASHWIAWMARPGDGRPEGGWTMVGQTQEEAESRAREWWSRHSAEILRYPSPSSSNGSSNMSPSDKT